MEPIRILVTLDKNYVYPLKVMLFSMFWNNPGETFDIYLMGDHFPEKKAMEIDHLITAHGSRFFLIPVADHLFDEAPVFRHYTKAMYYRLLASYVLPQDLDRILYMDPDILVINPLRPLYELDLEGNLFAAGIHEAMMGMTEYVNKVRLSTFDTEGYFNSGVMVMDLERQRKYLVKEDIFAYVNAHRQELILPDQDVLNGLYGKEIKAFDDSLYNYDARKMERYRLLSKGEKNMDWVLNHTAILHFCGKNKPWKQTCKSPFMVLYRHYEKKLDDWEQKNVMTGKEKEI